MPSVKEANRDIAVLDAPDAPLYGALGLPMSSVNLRRVLCAGIDPYFSLPSGREDDVGMT